MKIKNKLKYYYTTSALICLLVVMIFIVISIIRRNNSNSIDSNKKTVSLITQYYIPKWKERQTEIDETLINNINDPYIDEIYLFVEKEYNFEMIKSKVKNFDKVKLINRKSRLSFKMAFEFANHHIAEENIKILSNSDIYFNNTLTNVHSINLFKTVLCLSRHEITNDKLEITKDTHWTQDVWIWTDIINITPKSNNKDYFKDGIMLGIGGCDNRITAILKSAGYNLQNCCKKIICIHNHKNDLREWTKSGAKRYLPDSATPHYFISCTDSNVNRWRKSSGH